MAWLYMACYYYTKIDIYIVYSVIFFFIFLMLDIHTISIIYYYKCNHCPPIEPKGLVVDDGKAKEYKNIHRTNTI